jgi:hypothetical protein
VPAEFLASAAAQPTVSSLFRAVFSLFLAAASTAKSKMFQIVRDSHRIECR